jgi:hypothetical protein
MKNIKPFNGNCFGFYKEVVSRKKDQDYIRRISLLSPKVQNRIEEYQNKFASALLQIMKEGTFELSERDDLLRLYNYRSTLLQKLKIELTTDEYNRVSNTCPNCTIGEVNSFDHYLPKIEFPEFVVNPLNLIPCCSQCNSNKNASWRHENNRLFLNPYIDNLPNVQFLFVDLKILDNGIDLTYFLDPKRGIASNLFYLIQSHYAKLNLLERFKQNSDYIISELETEIKKYSQYLSIDTIKDTVIEECESNYRLLGRNNWKLVLKMALVNNAEYMGNF